MSPESSLPYWCLAGIAACLLALAQQLDASDVASEIETMRAIEEDKAALASREWAARQVCGPESAWNWVGDDLQCQTKHGRKTGRVVVAQVKP